MHPLIAGALRSGVKFGSAAADLAVRPHAGIVILIYHRVGSDSGGQMDIPLDRFAEQMGWLAENQRVLTLDEAVAELGGAGPITPGVAVTFDDGTDDWADNVAPVLARHRVPATFYVATSFVDERLEFPGGGRPISWAGLRDLQSCGFATIGSHTHHHLLLDRLGPDAIDGELSRADELIGEHLGTVPTHFCYPKAVAPSERAASAVSQRYRTAVLAGTRANQLGADPYRLARSPVQASDGPRWFRAKVAGGMGAEDRLRERLNHRRYRSATS